MAATRTFNSSTEALNYLQDKFGSVVYTDWQKLRRQFYSYVLYPEAGGNVFTFFGAPVGATTTLTFQLTNMPSANTFGLQHFLLSAIRCKLFIKTNDLQAWDGTIASTLASDYLMGFMNAGVMTLTINGKDFAQIPRPFLYAPPADGRRQMFSEGYSALTVSSTVLSTFVSQPPGVSLNPRKSGVYLMQPQILIEAQQTFNVSISFPTGAVPVVGTGITDDTTNPLYIGVSLDGEVYRPMS